jgi:hypothetical protein
MRVKCHVKILLRNLLDIFIRLYFIAVLCSMNLLWLVIVLISFHNVSADPPALLSVEYTVKGYQSLDAGRQVAVLTGKL